MNKPICTTPFWQMQLECKCADVRHGAGVKNNTAIFIYKQFYNEPCIV